MMRVRVFIATTEGPVAVQKITAEDPDVPSVACRDGTTEVLAISPDYTRFVDRGTGLVAQLTGHGAYRLDLDRPVDGGRSWQLPVLLAHLLDAEQRLAGPEEPAELAILATGEVDREQRVRPVGRIAEKLAAAQDLVAGCREDGLPLVVLLPADDRHVGLEDRPEFANEGAALRICAWDRVKHPSALEACERETALAPETGSARNESKPARAGRRWSVHRLAGTVLLLAAIAGLAMGVAWWTGPRQWEALRRAGDYAALDRALREAFLPALAERYRVGLLARAPAPEAVAFGVEEYRTADGRPCNPGRFGRIDTGRAERVQTQALEAKPGAFRSERRASLCRAAYRIANAGDRLFYVYFAVRPPDPTDGDVNAASASLYRAGALAPGASLALELPLTPMPESLPDIELLALAVSSPAPQLRLAFRAAISDNEEKDWQQDLPQLSALAALGMTIGRASHAIGQ